MRTLRPLLARASSLPAGRAAPSALLPPIPLYRRLLRAHRRCLPSEMRVLGDEYVKGEFRAHREVENPMHIVSLWSLFSSWGKWGGRGDGGDTGGGTMAGRDKGGMGQLEEQQLTHTLDRLPNRMATLRPKTRRLLLARRSPRQSQDRQDERYVSFPSPPLPLPPSPLPVYFSVPI